MKRYLTASICHRAGIQDRVHRRDPALCNDFGGRPVRLSGGIQTRDEVHGLNGMAAAQPMTVTTRSFAQATPGARGQVLGSGVRCCLAAFWIQTLAVRHGSTLRPLIERKQC